MNWRRNRSPMNRKRIELYVSGCFTIFRALAALEKTQGDARRTPTRDDIREWNPGLLGVANSMTSDELIVAVHELTVLQTYDGLVAFVPPGIEHQCPSCGCSYDVDGDGVLRKRNPR